MVKAVPARLQCSALYRPWAVRMGLCTALPPPQLYVSLRPHTWQGGLTRTEPMRQLCIFDLLCGGALPRA